MPLTQVRKGGLLLPDGSTHSLSEKDVLKLTPNDIRAFSWLQQFLANTGRQVELRCMKCGHSITGTNNGQSKALSMACRCTEWRLDGR